MNLWRKMEFTKTHLYNRIMTIVEATKISIFQMNNKTI